MFLKIRGLNLIQFYLAMNFCSSINAAPISTSSTKVITTLSTGTPSTTSITSASSTAMPVTTQQIAASKLAICDTSEALFSIPFAAGDGSNSSPYIICTEEQFSNISDEYSDSNMNFSLGASLDFKNKTFVPIGSETNPFRGTFKGNFNAISNVTLVLLPQPSLPKIFTYSGVFQFVSGGKISDLEIINVSCPHLKSNRDFSIRGGLVGLANQGSVISNVSVSGTLGIWKASTGGIAGQLDNSTIRNSRSYVHLQVGFGSYGGGVLVGTMVNNAQIYSSTAQGLIDSPYLEVNNTFSTHFLGGIVGYATQSTLVDTMSSSVIKINTGISQQTNIAGLIGHIDGGVILKSVGFLGSISVFDLRLNLAVLLKNRGASPGGILFGTVSGVGNSFASDWNNLNSP